MIQVNITDVKTQVSQLVELALRGKKVVITKHNKPMVELKPVVAQTRARNYMQILKTIKGSWNVTEEVDKNRKEVEKQIKAHAL